MSATKTVAIVVVALLGILAWNSVYVVDERELALKFRFGQFVEAKHDPGLQFKWPFINNVRKFERRIMSLDARPANYLTQEKKNVIVDFFVKWRVNDVGAYYRAMAGNESTAAERLYAIVNDGLRSEFSNRNIQDVVSGERSLIMNNITAAANEQVGRFGMEVVDVRIKRIDLPREVSTFVYRRMEAERARVAKDLRSRGEEQAEKIRAEADRQRTVLLAEAYKEAQQIRGEGDAKATQIYGEAFGQNPEFFAFHRSLAAYDKAFGKEGNVLVLQPDSEFFKYFTNATRTPAAR